MEPLLHSSKLNSGEDAQAIVRPASRRSLNPADAWTIEDNFSIGSDSAPASGYMDVLRRNRWRIVKFALGGATIALAATLFSVPEYRSRTSLEIQNLNTDFMNTRAVSATGDTSGSASEINLQTQIKILQSEALAQRTQNEMMKAAHENQVDSQDIGSRLMRMVHLGEGRQIDYAKLVHDAPDGVKVKPIGITRLVEITCDSRDAQFASRYCAELTSNYGKGDLETRSEEAQQTSDFLARQLADVRKKAQESQRQLELAVGGNGLILSQQTDSVGEDRLRQLQGELVKAQADRMQLEAASNVARAAAPDTMPNVMDSPIYRQYETKLAELRSKVAEIVPPLTEENPRVIHLRSQIREAELGLAASRKSSATRQSNEYVAAKHREDLLAVAYRTQAASVSGDLQKASRVSLLRREVESEQSLYQTLLQRAKEAGFASALRASTIRTVDPPKVPSSPYSPHRGQSAVAGLLMGSLCGLGVSFFKDRKLKVFRKPGDSEHYLSVHELGVIPRFEPPKGSERGLMTLLESGNNIPASGEILGTRWDDTFSIVAEAYRSATFSILHADTGKQARTYVIASPSSGDGKTTVIANLGIALSRSRLRVLLIDGDMRKPQLHKAFSLSNNIGLRDILRGEVDLRKTSIHAYCQQTAIPSLSVIPSGPGSEDAVSLLHSTQLNDLLLRLASDFDVVLIDTPPALHMADARIFAGQADGAVLILRAGVTSRDEASAARDLFENDGVRLVGTILTAFDPVSAGLTNYYTSYDRYQEQGQKGARAV